MVTVALPSPVRIGLVAALLALPCAAQLRVVSTTPAPHALAVPTAATVHVTFDQSLDRGSVSASSFGVFGRWSGVVPGTLSFSNGDRTVGFAPARPYFPGETVHVAISSAVRAAAGGSLSSGHSFGFWTASAAGSSNFVHSRTIPVRRPGETRRIRTYGAYAGDLDGDGAPDLTLPNEDADDVRVMLGDGCGGFAAPVSYALSPGSVPSPIEGADLDGDGDLDCAVANTRGNSFSILLGDGRGGFAPAVDYPLSGTTRGLALLDVDADGDVDVITAQRSASNLALSRNRGDGTFDPPFYFDGGGSQETAVAAADANGDGIADLFVGNFSSRTVTLLLGDGRGGFSLSATRAVQGSPWMIMVGDVDGDGAVDAAVCNSSADSASVVRGDGAGGLLAARHYPAGSFPLAVDLGDVDGDGDLDLAVSNYSGGTFTLYRNDGAGNFGSPTTFPASSAGSCMIVVDHDRDGDMDLLGIDELDDLLFVFEQTGAAPPGVQPASCEATLRVDELAASRGYGGRGAHPVVAGEQLFLGVTAGPATAYLALFGSAQEPGVAITFGLLNLGGPEVLGAIRSTDLRGEDRIAIPIPLGLPPGLSLAFQAAAADLAQPAGIRLSNPEKIVIR